MIILKVLGVIAAIWFGFWALVWAWWFLFGGHKSDKSGDGTLGIIAFPFYPFILVWDLLKNLFGRR